MCHLSAGEPDAAAGLLEPVADLVLALGVGEPVISPFFADSVQALTAVGRADGAVPLVEMLETWGHRSGSIWATGVAARDAQSFCSRRVTLTAQRRRCGLLSMPWTSAHTATNARARQLVWAAVHRRRRQRVQAREALVVARDEFASLGASGWQANADREIKRPRLAAERDPGAHPQRAPDRHPRRLRSHQQCGRHPAVDQPQKDGRGPPEPHLRQAGYPLLG